MRYLRKSAGFLLTIAENSDDFIDYDFFKCNDCATVTPHLRHIRFPEPLFIQVDGKTSQAVIRPDVNREERL